MKAAPYVECPYCNSTTCQHPSRREAVAFVAWLLERTGDTVLHVFARRERGSLVYDCPICRQQHRHGDAYGSRSTHCRVGVPLSVVLHPEPGEAAS